MNTRPQKKWMITIRPLGISCVLLTFICIQKSIAEDKPLKRVLLAGAAAIEITPPLGEMVVGGFVPFPANQIHDPLFAKCIALDDGENRIAIVICDNLGIRREEFDKARRIIAERTEILTANILMAATHTHSATRGQTEKYSPILIEGIAQAVQKAVDQLEPARIGWSSIDEPSEVFNRRWFIEDETLRHNPFGGVDQVRMNPPRGNLSLVEPAGPIDPEISVLSIQAIDGTQLALLGNYSLHYVGGVTRGEISADYFGLFAEKITKKLGQSKASHPPMVGILSNGTSGDINNINFRARDGRRWAPYEKMEQVADLIANRVEEAHRKIEHQDWIPIRSIHREIPLKVRKSDPSLRDYHRELSKKDETDPVHHRYEKIYADRVRNLDLGPNQYEIPLQCICLGDLAILGIPFETFAEIGLELKAKSPFKKTFTIELANDSRGYLPTPRQHRLGGYETWMGTNRVEKNASEKITATLLEMLRSVK
nr:hypothetical protein [Rhodopirellula sp.]